MDSFGWANAWRSLCWARLKDADKAYQLVVNNLRPSIDGSNGTALNLFDIYEVETGPRHLPDRGQLRHPAAVIEMLLYSRPGHWNCCPALPDAWAEVRLDHRVGVRGGFVVDLRWRTASPPRRRIRSVGGRTTTVAYGGTSRTVT
jgi:alpha-L-fucosidase 2